MDKTVKINKTTKVSSREELDKLSKEELIAQILTLRAHNSQLKNIIAKKKDNVEVNSTKSNNKPKSSRNFDFSKCKFRHVLLKFYYLGWDYQGYVVQEDTQKTIEHHLFEALTKTCLIKNREESKYHRCGRTDKGVSAFGQVISIDLRSKLNNENQDQFHDEFDYCQLLNRVLPDDIQCIAWCPVETAFSARFDCKSRSYKYFFPRGNLNINKMIEGVKFLIGTHDFRNLCKMDVANGVTEFIRNIEDVGIEPFNVSDSELHYSMYIFTIKSKGFLWHQIRCIMSVLFLIGEGKEEPQVIDELLNIKINTRKPDYNMSNEIPLNLFHCEYDAENWQLSEQNFTQIIKKLQGQWTINNVKSSMLKAMLSELKHMQEPKSDNAKSANEFVNVLNRDNKTKRYVPLRDRPKCDGLEEKIEHFLKRRKLERTTTPPENHP